mgnify:CR=1 FL=1
MKTIKISYYLLTCVFLAWLLLSWLDVVIHNTTPGYEYSDTNLIYLIVKGILK